MSEIPPQYQPLHAVADELQAILTREDLGGIVIVMTEDRLMWRPVLPSWIAAVFDDKDNLHVTLGTLSPEQRLLSNRTVGCLKALHDAAATAADFFGELLAEVLVRVQANEAAGKGNTDYRPE